MRASAQVERIQLLAEQREVVGADLPPRPDQERPGAAARVADAVARLWRHDRRQQPRHLGGRVELAALLAGVRREIPDQVLIHIADDIPLPDLRRPQIQPLVVEVLEQVHEPDVALLGLAEVRFAVEVDVAEHALQLGLVGIFDAGQRLVDALADVRLLALRVQVIEVALLRQHEALTRHGALDALLVAAVTRAVLLELFLAQVRQVLHEQHHQDVVLVLRRIDRAAKRIAGAPYDVVDGLLVRHGLASFRVFDRRPQTSRRPPVVG